MRFITLTDTNGEDFACNLSHISTISKQDVEGVKQPMILIQGSMWVAITHDSMRFLQNLIMEIMKGE